MRLVQKKNQELQEVAVYPGLHNTIFQPLSLQWGRTGVLDDLVQALQVIRRRTGVAAEHLAALATRQAAVGLVHELACALGHLEMARAHQRARHLGGGQTREYSEFKNSVPLEMHTGEK